MNDVAAALGDEQTMARGLIVDTEHPRFGKVRQVASPVRVGAPVTEHRRAPERHADAGDILRHLLRYPEARIRRLASAGALGKRRER